MAKIRYRLPPGEYTMGIKVFEDFRLSEGGERYMIITLPKI
jgi:hypothetical protein